MGIVPMHNLEDAPEVLGHASISKLAVRATTERRTSWSGGGYLRIGGNNIYLGIQYILRRNSTAGTTAKLIL